MRKLLLRMSMSLDGFVGGPNGELDWIFRDLDEESIAFGVAQVSVAGVHAMGAKTYRDMAAHWPTSTEPWAAPMNAIPKVVFSKTLQDAPWGPVQILRGDLVDEVARLKAEPGNDIMVHGGAGLARSLTRLNLVDEYWLLIHPVALGAGLPTFNELPRPLDLKLVTMHAFPKGTMAMTYRAHRR